MPTHHIDLGSYEVNEIFERARCSWLTPVILAAVEAENRRIAVQSQWAHDVRAYLENT
jgi:hypothetical protein